MSLQLLPSALLAPIRIGRQNSGDAGWDIVQMLVAHGADINQRDAGGGTALLSARDVRVVRFLVEWGADVNAVDRECTTALHVAAARGDQEKAELLISHGADVNPIDVFGRTPLDCSLMTEEHGMATLLRQNGAVRGPGTGKPLWASPLAGRAE